MRTLTQLGKDALDLTLMAPLLFGCAVGVVWTVFEVLVFVIRGIGGVL